MSFVRRLTAASRLTLLLLSLACPGSQSFAPAPKRKTLLGTPLSNTYDDWRADAVAPTMPLSEENVQSCLQEFVYSDYGQQMFGCHEKAAGIGITGEIEMVEVSGPEVILALSGKFWHRRETVLGRAAMWLNACMPEIVQVQVDDMEQLKDFEQFFDDVNGELLYEEDKRAPDFNGDRETMEYQGIDPDIRGPFPFGGMSSGDPLINPI